MTDNKEPRNISNEEMLLIQATFDERLLQAIRAVVFNLTPTPEEQALVQSTFANPKIFELVQRRLYPVLSKTSPIGQVQDAWLGVEQMIFGVPKDTIYQAVQYKDQALKMTAHALELLKDPTGRPIDLDYSPVKASMDELQVMLLARNQFIRHIEQQLLFLLLISKQPSPKEKELAAAKDSTK